jgi:hypothetical protein
MKKIIISLAILTIALAFSCKKEDNTPQYNPDDVVVTLKVSTQFYEKAYLVLENANTSPVYQEIVKGETHLIKRGDSIMGETINLHFVFIDVWAEGIGEISSYFEVPLGKEIQIASGTGNHPKVTQNQTDEKIADVNISFSDVPEFDIATRSAWYPLHCHTFSTLEIPCPNTYPPGNNFYVCLQKGDKASYKLVNIPEGSDYVISLNDLNDDMTKYSIPKNPAYMKSIKVKAYGSGGLLGIFSNYPEDESLFQGNTIDIFTPNGIPEMTTFSTIISVYEEQYKTRRSIYSPRNYVVTDYTLLDVDISINCNPGQLPSFSTSGSEYHYISVVLDLEDYSFCKWRIIAPRPSSIYAPELPLEVLDAMPTHLANFFSNSFFVNVTAVYDTRYENYNNAIDHILNIISMDEEEYLSSIVYKQSYISSSSKLATYPLKSIKNKTDE